MSAKAMQLLGLIVMPLVISVGQILFKIASEKADLSDVRTLAMNAHLWAAVVLYGTATLAWVFVIRGLPISRAYIFMALTFVYVPILSAIFLGDALSLKLALGVGLICLGVYVAVA
jgi:drug/metabolite transporter (DMT)-like permease